MFKTISTPQKNITAFSVIGLLSKEDYTQTLIPLMEEASKQNKKLNVLLQFGEEFEGFTPAAAWEDFKLGVHYMSSFSRIAVVSDKKWITRFTEIFGHLMPCSVKTFSSISLEDGIKWLSSSEN